MPLSGVATQVKLSAASLPFGSVTVGQSKPLPVTLTNFGTTVVSIVSPGIVITGTAAADYSQTNTCGSSVGAGQNCTITVTFKPTKIGSRAAVLNINDNGGPSPQKVTLIHATEEATDAGLRGPIVIRKDPCESVALVLICS